jgi:hypothetical protein
MTTLSTPRAAIGAFLRQAYNTSPHSGTGRPPQQRWETGAFIPRMPASLAQLDLLLMAVAKPPQGPPRRDPLPGLALPGPRAGRLRRRAGGDPRNGRRRELRAQLGERASWIASSPCTTPRHPTSPPSRQSRPGPARPRSGRVAPRAAPRRRAVHHHQTAPPVHRVRRRRPPRPLHRPVPRPARRRQDRLRPPVRRLGRTGPAAAPLHPATRPPAGCARTGTPWCSPHRQRHPLTARSPPSSPPPPSNNSATTTTAAISA